MSQIQKKLIFEQPFCDNFGDNHVFLSSYWSKTMKREKGRERIRTSCEYERENCPKVVTKWMYKYHFSKNNTLLYIKTKENSTVKSLK